jgi:hypothetical protein
MIVPSFRKRASGARRAFSKDIFGIQRGGQQSRHTLRMADGLMAGSWRFVEAMYAIERQLHEAFLLCAAKTKVVEKWQQAGTGFCLRRYPAISRSKP